MTSSCPKSMAYGPCGGVQPDGTCEVGSDPCTFLHVGTVRWTGEPPAPRAPVPSAAERTGDRLSRGGVVVADFPGRALDPSSLSACAGALAGRVDAVLAGDSGDARVQVPPTWRAHLLQDAGVPVWAGLNCRDRNRVALEGELAGLAEVGVAAVHCVTGDHTRTGGRPDAQPVFDLDATRLAALAREAGHLVSVGESPATAPTAGRPARLLEKQRAGAQVCFVNHAGGAGPVAGFVQACRALGVTAAFLACVPVVLSRESAELLLSFTAMVLPPGYLQAVLAAPDPRAAGVEAAVRLSREMLAVDGVAGVNLSGGPAGGDERAFAEGLGEIAERLRSG